VVKNGLEAGAILLDAASGNMTGANSVSTGNLSVTGISNLGNISNVYIAGGENKQTIFTDGAGNLIFAPSDPAPMPTLIDTGDTITINANYQGLFGYPITIDGNMTVDGILIDINDNRGNINNGTSNINIETSNGNITTGVAGIANVLVVTATGANVNGTLSATGNIIGGNVTTLGTLTATTVTETSSITLKENFRPIENPVEQVMQLLGQIYDRKDGSSNDEAGLVAEHVYKVIPNLVKTDKDGNPESVLYTRLTVYLLESIKVLKDEIDTIKELLSNEKQNHLKKLGTCKNVKNLYSWNEEKLTWAPINGNQIKINNNNLFRAIV
jgi:hypothetical protein